MSLAQRHRDRILAAQTVSAATAPADMGGAAPAAGPLPAAGAADTPAARAAAQIGLRLTHDLRRLREIRSIDKKIEAKREMLPEYASWVEGLLMADSGTGTGLAAEVAPTVMVWRIDTGDYAGALTIADFLLRHGVAMPSRYERDVATVIVEEIADAALKLQGAGQAFPIAALIMASDLTADRDIHDQARAKLIKAIGAEQLRAAEELPAEDSRPILQGALASFTEAHRLNDRVGVKDKIKRASKLLAALDAAAQARLTATEQGGAPAA